MLSEARFAAQTVSCPYLFSTMPKIFLSRITNSLRRRLLRFGRRICRRWFVADLTFSGRRALSLLILPALTAMTAHVGFFGGRTAKRCLMRLRIAASKVWRQRGRVKDGWSYLCPDKMIWKQSSARTVRDRLKRKPRPLAYLTARISSAKLGCVRVNPSE